MKDVFISWKQNKPFHSSISTRNQSVSSIGKVETTGSTFRQETRISEATIIRKIHKRVYDKKTNTFLQ